MRTINERFIQDLNGGCLSFFLNQVKEKGKELCLEIRDGYINIYYKGGNLLKIKQMKKGYRFFFDSKYCLHKEDETNYELLKFLNPDYAQDYIENFEIMKKEMDSWFEKHPKAEREFQHKLLANNPNIIDIEYAPPKSKVTGVKLNMRLDMLMVEGDRLTIVENKFGVGAITGNAGIEKHYNDICRLLNTEEIYEELVQSAQKIADAKYSLGLLEKPIQTIDKSKTEILFLLADYNEKSETLRNELSVLKLTYPIKLLKMSSNDSIIDLNKVEII